MDHTEDEPRECPKCGAPEGDLKEEHGLGFAGGLVYFTRCTNCGNICNIDESGDIAAAR